MYSNNIMKDIKLVCIKKYECQYYLTENCIRTIDNCVCNKKHRFYYKASEFDRDNFNTPVVLTRICSGKPIDLVIVKPNKDIKCKIDWKDQEAVKEYKKEQKRTYDAKHKVSNNPITPPNTPEPKKKVVIKKKLVN